MTEITLSKVIKADEGYVLVKDSGFVLGSEFWTTEDADTSNIHQVKDTNNE